jgi:hypothetical protein
MQDYSRQLTSNPAVTLSNNWRLEILNSEKKFNFSLSSVVTRDLQKDGTKRKDADAAALKISAATSDDSGNSYQNE